jgi:hypothetical protein
LKSTEEFLAKLKRWPEKTSTSPSGIHLGHYHALFKPHGLKEDSPAERNLADQRHLLLNAHVALLNYATKFRYVYSRWKQVVNIMLLKDPGKPRIH